MEVGVDVGGTRTRVVVADGDRILAQAEVPTSQWRQGGLLSDEANADRLLAVVPGEVVGRADVPIVIGAHGCDTQDQCDTLTAWLARTHPGPIRVLNDAELFGPAIGLPQAISVVSGTGSIVVGRNREGQLVKVGGHGWLLGDPGAAPVLVRESVTAILDADDRGEAPGVLAHLLMDHYGSADPVGLSYDFTDDLSVTQWGSLAPLVFQAADAGDKVAIAVIDNDGGRLAADVHALRGKNVDSTDVVLAGGVITAQPLLRQAFTQALAQLEPTVRVHVLHEAPVHGAVAIARSLRP